jgi:hypothetical protein
MSKKLASMRPAVCKASERLVSFGDHFFDFVGEIRKSSLDEVNVFPELVVPIFALSQRAPKLYVFGQQYRNEALIEAVPHLMVEALDQLPVSVPHCVGLLHFSLSRLGRTRGPTMSEFAFIN